MAFVRTGSRHTVTLSNDSVVHSFGQNLEGQLGLGHNQNIPLPSPIPNLPPIKLVACGYNFTVCVTYEGIMWSFGHNVYGQLGTGNNSSFNVPQQITDVPPVQLVACGADHTVIITNDSELWSSGNNDYGQLCLLNQVNGTKFQKTSFSDILKISTGYAHTLFQNKNGEIYGCGYNYHGELGLGHFETKQIIPTCIPKLPLDIIEFTCGYYHNLYLDSEGNVFSGGLNQCGQLGLSHVTNKNVLNQIINIPPIQTISCVGYSSYLIDFDGNVWSFGMNSDGQLGHGDTRHRNVPTKIDSLKNIKQISCGCSGCHFLAKDNQNTIFVMGFNENGLLGSEGGDSFFSPEEMDSQYFTIWGDVLQSRAKSARK